ncbi:hypothetical protein ACWGI8_40850, partial [Streptomyces sp. NPDC054841]
HYPPTPPQGAHVKRRARLTAVAAALAGSALSLATATGAQAHGDTLKVEITGHDFGRVRTTVVWENDNDPVDERVAATVNAVGADGTTVGPWKLVRDPAATTGYATAEALPPGRWKVTVEVGYPGLGRDQEEITVSPGTPASPTAAPGAAKPGVSAVPGTAQPGTATSTDTGHSGGTEPARPGSSGTGAAAAPAGHAASGTGTGTLLVVGGAALLVCAAGAGVVWRTRRARARAAR